MKIKKRVLDPKREVLFKKLLELDKLRRSYKIIREHSFEIFTEEILWTISKGLSANRITLFIKRGERNFSLLASIGSPIKMTGDYDLSDVLKESPEDGKLYFEPGEGTCHDAFYVFILFEIVFVLGFDDTRSANDFSLSFEKIKLQKVGEVVREAIQTKLQLEYSPRVDINAIEIQKAGNDPTTDLPNKVLLREELEKKKAKMGVDWAFVVIVVNDSVSLQKNTNDETMEMVLFEFAELLRLQKKKMPDSFFVRFGVAEFLGLIRGSNQDVEVFLKGVEKGATNIGKHLHIAPISFSAGSCRWAIGVSNRRLIDAANFAAKAASERGKLNEWIKYADLLNHVDLIGYTTDEIIRLLCPE